MLDSEKLAFCIRAPWWHRWRTTGERCHPVLVSIWYVDPQTDDSDDSCEWPGLQPRPWWKDPRWHFWRWKFHVHPIWARWLFERCWFCGKRFRWWGQVIWSMEGPEHRRCGDAIFDALLEAPIEHKGRAG